MSEIVVDDALSAEFLQLTEKEHSIEKSMHLGSHKVATYEIYTYKDDTITKERLKYSQVFYKMFDEILVNAMDVKMKYNTIKVIEVTFCQDTGEVTISNDGKRGIPCGGVKTSAGRPVLLPEMLFTQFRSGSNHKRCKKSSENIDNISTGTNGYGCKLVTVNSERVVIITHDQERKIKYTQRIENQMETINPPVIETLKRGQNGTTIKYMAHWSLFTGWLKRFGPHIFDVMDGIFHARVIFASAYLGIPITYNGRYVQTTNAMQLSKYFITDPISATLKPNEKPAGASQIYPWNICVGVQPNPTILSVVNGACVSAGQHIDHLMGRIVEKIKPLIEKMFKKSNSAKYQKRMITNYLSLVFVGIIPDIEFDSQLKTKLICSDEFVAHYNVPPKIIKQIWENLEPLLFDQYMIVTKKTPKRRTMAGRDKDYEPALWAGKSGKETYLFPSEGQSAASLVRRCLLSKDVPGLTFKNCGIYCLGGVTTNVHKEVEVIVGRDGKRSVIMSKKAMNAPKFNAFLKIMNLDPAIDYMDLNDIKTLVYSKIVFMTDADVDGVGNICGIALSNIQLLWPGLFHHNVVYRLSTPVQRWYPADKSAKIVNFYTDAEARMWMDQHTNARGKLKYFKGLATHSNEDAIDMFQSFHHLITEYRSTEHSDEISKHFFGDDVTMRKIYHSDKANMNDKMLDNLYRSMSSGCKTPLQLAVQRHVIQEPKYPETGIEKCMTVEQHMLTYCMEYQNANNDRSLPHIIDGLLRTHRKCVFAGMYHNKGESKVFQMGGRVADKMAYHNGSASIEGVLVKMAQCFPGANNVPLFLPIGQYGSRSRGGKDAGSSRYISTDINPIAYKLFREEDMYILPYTPEDGILVEPDYLCPVFPHVMNIHHDNIGHAWYCGTYARDHVALLTNVIMMMDGDDAIQMPPGLCGWHGKTINVDGTEYSMGEYRYDEKSEMIYITELPFRKWNNDYIYSNNGIASKDFVASVEDHSTDTEIDIRVQLKPSTMDYIINTYGGRQFDPVIECFKLKLKMNTFMNFIGPNHTTLHFTIYEDMLRPWFNVRKNLYVVRVRRQSIITRLRITYYEHLIRFINNYNELNVATGKNEEEADEFLANHEFARFNKTMLDNPKFTPIDEIEDAVLRGSGSSYEYIKAAHHPTRRTPKAQVANQTTLDNLRKLLDELADPSIVTKTWISELMEYDAAYQKGMRDGWVEKRR